MKAEIWLARCAAELEHLQVTHSSADSAGATPEERNMDTAGKLIKAERYLGLDPVQAARIYWRDSLSSLRP